MARVFARGDQVIARRERVRAPFPDIAGDVEQAMAVWRKGVHRRGAGIAVLGRVVVGEISLPDVAAVARRRASVHCPRGMSLVPIRRARPNCELLTA